MVTRCGLRASRANNQRLSFVIILIYGSVRAARQGIKAARYVANACRERGHEVFLADPVAFPLPLLDKVYQEYSPGDAPTLLERLAERVKAADAYVIVSGEYNHCEARRQIPSQQ
jgi:NAD(P)H-dependent FMN reductase